MILAGDIGGTKTTLALYVDDKVEAAPLHVQTYRSQDHAHFFAILDDYLKTQNQRVQSACFAVAGPVFDQSCQTTNLPWIVDAEKIARRYKIGNVFLLNDLEATAHGALRLSESSKVLLNDSLSRAPAPPGNRAIIAPGTGLGEALLYWDGAQYHPSASEGGHTDFGPRNDLEIALLQSLLKTHQHVSYERLLCGPGLLTIYEFLKTKGPGEEPRWLTERLAAEDSAAVISEVALAEKSSLCMQALHCFVSLLGAEAGNLALKVLATGGMYVGGGIPPKILPKLKDGTFMAAFVQKGRYTSLLEKIPVWVILAPQTALQGAAHYAVIKDP